MGELPDLPFKFMWEKESKLALEAVKAVAPRLLGDWDRNSIKAKTSLKDMVTALDTEVEKELLGILSQSGHRVLAEESFHATKQFVSPPYWCIDPIDGTLNFISQIPLYGTSIGFYDGKFQFGAISLPKLDEYYYVENNAAWMNGKKLDSKSCAINEALIVDCFAGSESHKNSKLSQVRTSDASSGNLETLNESYALYAELLGQSRGVLRLGSVAAGFAFLAAGRVQGIIGRQCEIWDAAGGLAIVQYAGCETWFQLFPGSTKIDFIAAVPGVMSSLRAMTAERQLLAA